MKASHPTAVAISKTLLLPKADRKYELYRTIFEVFFNSFILPHPKQKHEAWQDFSIPVLLSQYSTISKSVQLIFMMLRRSTLPAIQIWKYTIFHSSH